MYIPYVYIIKNKTTQLKYLGVRYAKNCHPNDFWVTYFTSSKLVKKLIDLYGKEDFYIKILHKFPNDPEKAVLKEAHYFPMIKKRDDYLNLTYSSGVQDLRIASKAGKIGGRIVKELGIGIFRCYEERKIWSSMGGTAGSKVQIENKIGIHGQTAEERKYYSDMGRKKCKELKKGLFDPKIQSELGKRGGLKNKGFKWYNDGNKDYKYTAKQQTELPFEDFLTETGFNKGRTNSKSSGTMWVNDGIKNYMIAKEDFDQEIYQLGRLTDRSKFNGHKNKKN